MPDNQELVDTLVGIADDLLSNLDGGAPIARVTRESINNAQALDQNVILDRFYIFLANFYAETRDVEIAGEFDAEEARIMISEVDNEFYESNDYDNIMALMAALDGEFYLNRFARLADLEIDIDGETIEADDYNSSVSSSEPDDYGDGGGSPVGILVCFEGESR